MKKVKNCDDFLQGVTIFDDDFQAGFPICPKDGRSLRDVLKALCHICKRFTNSSLVQPNGAYCFANDFPGMYTYYLFPSLMNVG